MNNWKSIGDDGRIWFYGANRTLTKEELTVLKAELDSFCQNWAAHGEKLYCGYEIVYDQIVILSVDEGVAHASGCSIDSSVAIFRKLDEEFKIDLFNRMRVYVLKEGRLQTFNASEAKGLIESGEWTLDTKVINTLPKTKGDWSSNHAISLDKSWLKKYLPEPSNY